VSYAPFSGVRPVLSNNVAADRPSSAYTRARALRESTSLASAACVVHFCEVVGQYIRSGRGETTVRRLAAVVARETRRRGLPPERMLTAFRIVDCWLPRNHAELVGDAAIALRYLHVTRACLSEYFRTSPS
jgi:hypothetical protein